MTPGLDPSRETPLRPSRLDGVRPPRSPLVPAVIDGTTVYVSGCVPVDPRTGALAGDDIETQTRQVIRNLEQVLHAAGSSLALVAKTSVFITEQDEFERMNRVYGELFAAWLPARTTVVVAALARPGFRVEIEAVARTGTTDGR